MGGISDLSFKTTSPEYGTDGMLPKCWIRRSDGVYLLKGGTKGFNGADIEAVVCEAIEEVFLKRLDGENPDFNSILENIAKNTNSIGESCKQQIDSMEKIFKENNFTNAS